MDLPFAGEEGIDVLTGEIVRRPVGAIGHVELPGSANGRFQFVGQGSGSNRCGVAQCQHIPGPQGAAAVAAELPQGKRAAGGEVFRAVQATTEQHIGPGTIAGGGAELQGGACGHVNHLPQTHRLIVQGGVQRCAGEHNLGGPIKVEYGPLEGDFQARCFFRVAQQPVTEPERVAVERAGGRHTDFPIADPPGVILDGGHCAATEHVHGGWLVVEFIEGAGEQAAFHETRVIQHLAHVLEVGLNAVELALIQRLHQPLPGRFPIRLVHNHLGEHGVVQGRHFRARLYPGVDAKAVFVRPCHVGQQAGAGLEILVGILGIDPRLNGMSGSSEVATQPFQIRQGAGPKFHHPAHQVHTVNLFGHTVFYL